MLLIGQDGFEQLMMREASARGCVPGEIGRGWILATPLATPAQPFEEWCFAHVCLPQPHPQPIEGNSVNALAAGIAGWFLESARGERFEGPWPLRFSCAGGRDGLGRRLAAVERAVGEILQRRIARVARLASTEPPFPGWSRGLFVHLTDFGSARAARDAWSGGQCRMADDPAAPSRSYLKIEEAYRILGYGPTAGESVIDLGAAPGGWSFSAARRRARVIAVDNGPLKAGAREQRGIEHRREDAFRFRPASGDRVDWLLCDLVEEPHHVLRSIVEPWVAQRWCRRFVVNLKFGRAEPIALLEETKQRLAPHCRLLRVRHLFHDREEITVLGEVA